MKGNAIMKKFITGLLAVAVLLLTAPTMDAQAASSYIVTYRPGNVGYFAQAGTTATDKKDMAMEVARQLYSGNTDVEGIETTDNGAIKLTMAYGGRIPAAPTAGYIQVDAGYFVKNASEWGPGPREIVDRNVDYVVDYGRLVDGVEYTVQYVDDQSGTSVAPSTVAYGNIGDTVTMSAPANLTISGATYYAIADQAERSLVLSADSSVNLITFSYTAAPSGTVIETVVQYIPGQTIVTTETVQVPGPAVEGEGGAGAVLAPGQGDAQQQTPADDEADTPVEEDGAEDDGEEADDGEQGEEEIPDDEVPTTDEPATPDDGSDTTEETGVVDIEDDTVALAETPSDNTTLLVGAGLAIALLAAVVVIWIRKVHQHPVDQTEE